MNLDELQSVQSRERQTDSLQQLRASFYKDAAEFVQDLREERDEAAERSEDPFDSPDVNRLTDDIRTAEQTVEAIYERRVGKVVKMASLAAADMPTEQEGLTEEEQELFETMVTAIEDHREAILNVLGGESPAGTVAATPTDEDERKVAGAAEPDDDGLDAASVMGEGDDTSGPTDAPPREDGSVDDRPADASGDADAPGEQSDGRDTSNGNSGDGTEAAHGTSDDHSGADNTDVSDGSDPAGSLDGTDGTDDAAVSGGSDVDGADVEAIDTDRVTVRITEDVGEIFGVDEREYDLAADDVVTLPATNAEPLIERDAAEPLE